MSLLTLLSSRKFNPRSELFAANEQGLWSSPSNMAGGKTSWRRNLLSYTEDFSNSYWTKASVTTATEVVSNPINGTVTRLESTTTAAVGVGLERNIVSALDTFSFYVKKGNARYVGLTTQASATNTVFDLDAGTVASQAAFHSAATITAAGDGWYRITITADNSSSNATVRFRFFTGPTTIGAVTGDYTYITGAQLEERSTASAYQKITDFSTEFKAAFPAHALYQDSNGVTPCTSPGDPVGLVVDQRQGGLAALGPELLSDTGFDDAGEWQTNAGVTITGSEAVWNTASASVYVRQASIVEASKWYLVEIDVSSYTSGTLYFAYADGGTTVTQVALNSAKSYRFVVNTSAGAGRAWIITPAGGAVASVSRFSIREVAGNHLYQSSSPSRPTLVRRPRGGVRNLLTYSEQFDNAAWSKTNVSLTSGVSDPEGGNTAWTLTASAANLALFQVFNGLSGNQTNSIWIRRRTGTGVIRFYTQNAALTQQMQSVITSDWQRLSTATTAASGTSDRFGIILETSGDAVDIWHPQLETGSSATNYQKVVASSDVTESGQPDCWRLLFDGSDDFLQTNTLSFGSQSTTGKNYAQNSEDLTAATWTKATITILPDAVTGPFSRLADVMYPTITGTNRHIQFTTTNTLGGYVTSVYAKNYGSTNYYLVFTRGSTQDAFFNLQTGEVTGVASGCTAYMTDAGDGWWRCEFVYDAGSPSTRVHWLPTDATSGWTVTANGTDGIALTGFQLEVGSRASEYDPTGTDEMTVIAGVRKLSDAASGTVAELTASVSANNGSFALFTPSGAAAKNAFGSRGTTTVFAETTTGSTFAAPLTAVCTGISDVSTPLVVYRQNSTEYATSASSQGSGNYSNAILYVGRRAGTSLPFNGELGELIIRGRYTTGSKLTGAEKFAAGKLGISI